MRMKDNNLAFGLFIYLAFSYSAWALPSAANQTEQDKARQVSLTPEEQAYQSSRTLSGEQTILFPQEKNCRLIKKVLITSDNDRLSKKVFRKLINQANDKCLGIAGIRLLATTLQNELIAQGYVTSLIDIPQQTLENGELTLALTWGRVGDMGYSEESKQNTSLWNALPAAKGNILQLADLEQGMANLQRLPGSKAHMRLLPGYNPGETDIKITRTQDKKWQVGAWLDDAGSRSSGRYQGGGALYLYDLTTLNDLLYVSGGGDVEFNEHHDGNQNSSVYYSLPFGYWALSLYGSWSQYLQQFKSRTMTTDYKSKNRYFSATLSRLLSQTRQQKTTAELRVFKSRSRYYFGGSELSVMRKQNPGWEMTLRHQHYFNKSIIDASFGVQRSLPWLSSSPTLEEKSRLYDKHSRVVHADIQGLMKFDLTGDKFSYAPRLYMQISPDILSTDNQINIGSRWSVRGFDGERNLSGNQGWYWRNDFIWDLPVPNQQFYLGWDIGRIIGKEQYRGGKVLSGAVAGLRGHKYGTQYDFFVGTPLTKPDDFHSDVFNMGFSLQWRY